MTSRKLEPYREKAYHFDDDPPIARESDMNATAHSLLRHDHPTRRHTVAWPVQQANRILSAAPTSTTTTVPAAQGRIIASGGGSQPSNDTPLTLEPMDGLTSSLTHGTQPISYAQESLSAYYPDFLRRRITPSRRGVVAEEVDKELFTE